MFTHPGFDLSNMAFSIRIFEFGLRALSLLPCKWSMYMSSAHYKQDAPESHMSTTSNHHLEAEC